MIRKERDMKLEQRKAMRGGQGLVDILHILPKEELSGGRLFSKILLRPGCSIGEHRHEGETEYYYILRGEGEVKENSGVRSLGPGDLVITGNGESHSIRNTGSEEMEFIALILFD